MLTLVRLPSCAESIREVKAEFIKEANPATTVPGTVSTPHMGTEPQAASRWQGLAGMGGRRWAGIGALAGGALGALNPGKDDDGESRGALSGALRGAMTGGLVGGLGGMAAKRIWGPTGVMKTMQGAREGAEGLGASQAQHAVNMSGAQQGLSQGLDKHTFNPGAMDAAMTPTAQGGLGHGFWGALGHKLNPFNSAASIQARTNVSRARQINQQGQANTHELTLAQHQMAHQNQLAALDPANVKATATTAATEAAALKAQANADAVHRAHGAHMNKLFPGGVDHRRLAPEDLKAKVQGLVDAGHIKGPDAVLAGHVPPGTTPPAPAPAPTPFDASAALYKHVRGGTAPPAGYAHEHVLNNLQRWADANPTHADFSAVQDHLADMRGAPKTNPTPVPPGSGLDPGRHAMHLRNAMTGGRIPQAEWDAMSAAQQKQIHNKSPGGVFNKFSSILNPMDVFSPMLKLAARPFSPPKKTVADRIQGAFAPRKGKGDHAPVAADAADPPKPPAAAKPAEAKAPETPADDKKTAAPATPSAAALPGPGPASAVAPLKTAETPVVAAPAPAAEPAKAAEAPATSGPVIKPIKLAALAA